MKKRRLLWPVVLLFLLAAPLYAEEERRQGYYTIVDEETGRLICRTGLVVHVGDEYLTADNLRYRVVKVKEDTAYAAFRGREDLSAFISRGANPGFFRWFLALVGKDEKRPVAIYHTHNDESYLPTDGTESIPGGGGVIRVGESLAARLRREKIPAVHSRAAHDPHDGLAYERSRRTAVALLRHNPSALLDIHRDAAPRQEYAEEIGGTGVTKIQIVLGRTNPNLKANETFAKQIKATIDRKYPGLIKGIFYGAGKYNQDLSPRALLLEFGAHTNARQSAERAAAIFARAAGDLLATPSRAALRGQNAGAWRAVLWVLGAAVVVALIFLFLNASGLGEAGRNLGRFFRREFASALGERRRRRGRGRRRRRG
ncbi:MAG: stage II sporulation protein P [Bacillota bacterium]